jgi:hypothetical protein
MSSSSPVRPAANRRAASHRRFFMTTNPDRSKCSPVAWRDDRRHHLASVARPFAPAAAQREGERIGEVFGAGWSEAIGVVGHEPRLQRQREQDKNGEGPGVRLRKGAK